MMAVDRRRSGWTAGRLFGGLAAIIALALAGWLTVRCGLILTGSRQPDRGSQAGAVLLISPAGMLTGQFNLFQAGLSAAGIANANLNLPDNQSADELKTSGQLQAALTALAESTGCDESRVWLALAGNTASVAWDAACAVRSAAGLLIFAAPDLDRLTDRQIQRWPGERSLAIIAGAAAGGLNQAERRFFEILTGEDTMVFPGWQDSPSQPIEYTSADGKIWLGLYPMLATNLAMVSPRVLPDAAGWLADSTADTVLAADYRKAALLMTELPFQLLLAGLLLLTALTGLNLLLILRPPALASISRPAPGQALPWTGEIILWLTALLLAGVAGWSVRILAAGAVDALYIALAILPGCRGWLFLLWRQVRVLRRPAAGSSVRPPRERFRILGLLIPVVLLATAAGWSELSLGTGLTEPRNWALLAVWTILNLPGGLAGTCGRLDCGPADGEQRFLRLGQSIWQHLPYLLLPIPLGLQHGLTGLAAGLLVLVIHFWSAGLGKAATLGSRSPMAGSLIQSAGYALGFLMPPVLTGLQGIVR